jgi:hypothetical protein
MVDENVFEVDVDAFKSSRDVFGFEKYDIVGYVVGHELPLEHA